MSYLLDTNPLLREVMRIDANGGLAVAPSQEPMTLKARYGVVSKYDEVRMDDLNSEAFSTPVDTLVDLWVARYGNAWIDLDMIESDPFYFAAYKRLRSLGMLETHYLTDRARFVCRKPE